MIFLAANLSILYLSFYLRYLSPVPPMVFVSLISSSYKSGLSNLKLIFVFPRSRLLNLFGYISFYLDIKFPPTIIVGDLRGVWAWYSDLVSTKSFCVLSFTLFIWGELDLTNTPPAEDRVILLKFFYWGIHAWLTFKSAVAAVSIHFWSGMLNLVPYFAAKLSTDMVINPASILPPFPVDK